MEFYTVHIDTKPDLYGISFLRKFFTRFRCKDENTDCKPVVAYVPRPKIKGIVSSVTRYHRIQTSRW